MREEERENWGEERREESKEEDLRMDLSMSNNNLGVCKGLVYLRCVRGNTHQCVRNNALWCVAYACVREFCVVARGLRRFVFSREVSLGMSLSIIIPPMEYFHWN